MLGCERCGNLIMWCLVCSGPDEDGATKNKTERDPAGMAMNGASGSPMGEWIGGGEFCSPDNLHGRLMASTREDSMALRPASRGGISAVSIPQSQQGGGTLARPEERARARFPPDADVTRSHEVAAKQHKHEVPEPLLRIEASGAASDAAHQAEPRDRALEDHAWCKSAEKQAEASSDSRRRPATGAVNRAQQALRKATGVRELAGDEVMTAEQVEDKVGDGNSKPDAEGAAEAGAKTPDRLKAPAAREPARGIAVASADKRAAAASAAAAAAARAAAIAPSHTEASSSPCTPAARVDRLVYLHDNNGVPALSTASARGCVVWTRTPLSESVVAALTTSRARAAAAAGRRHSTHAGNNTAITMPDGNNNTMSHHRMKGSGNDRSSSHADPAAEPYIQSASGKLERYLDNNPHEKDDNLAPSDTVTNPTRTHTYAQRPKPDKNVALKARMQASIYRVLGFMGGESGDETFDTTMMPGSADNDLARSWGIWRAYTTYQRLLQEAARSLRCSEDLRGFYTSSGEPLESVGCSLLLAAHCELHLIARTDKRPALRLPRRLALRLQTPSSSAIAFEYRESALKCRLREGAIVATYAHARRSTKGAASGRWATSESMRGALEQPGSRRSSGLSSEEPGHGSLGRGPAPLLKRYGLLRWRRSEDKVGAAQPLLGAFCFEEHLDVETRGQGWDQCGERVGKGVEGSAQGRQHATGGEAAPAATAATAMGSMRRARVRGVRLLDRCSVTTPDRKAEVAREEGGRDVRADPGGVSEGVRVFSRVGPPLWQCDGADCSFLFGGALVPLFFPPSLLPSCPALPLCPSALHPPIQSPPSFSRVSSSPTCPFLEPLPLSTSQQY